MPLTPALRQVFSNHYGKCTRYTFMPCFNEVCICVVYGSCSFAVLWLLARRRGWYERNRSAVTLGVRFVRTTTTLLGQAFLMTSLIQGNTWARQSGGRLVLMATKVRQPPPSRLALWAPTAGAASRPLLLPCTSQQVPPLPALTPTYRLPPPCSHLRS